LQNVCPNDHAEGRPITLKATDRPALDEATRLRRIFDQASRNAIRVQTLADEAKSADPLGYWAEVTGFFTSMQPA